MSKQWNRNMMWPTDSDYIIRVTDVNFDTSKSSGNPMVILESEVVSPNEKPLGADSVIVAGTKPSTIYLVTKSVKDPENTKSLDGTKERLKLMLPDDNSKKLIDAIDPDNVSQDLLNLLKGTLLYCVIYGKETERTKNPTQEQIDAAKVKGEFPKGDVMKNPLNGVPLVTYQPTIGEVFGPAPKTAGSKPF